jgi:rubrerythrin
LEIRIIFKIIMGAVAAALFLTGAGSMNVALASQDAAIHGTSSMPASYRMHVADNDNLNTLTKHHAQAVWVCPMHPEIHKHAPGKCPICKMNLVREKPKKT